jgi:hypothetical protein
MARVPVRSTLRLGASHETSADGKASVGLLKAVKP